jgi:hypothetical protein
MLLFERVFVSSETFSQRDVLFYIKNVQMAARVQPPPLMLLTI